MNCERELIISPLYLHTFLNRLQSDQVKTVAPFFICLCPAPPPPFPPSESHVQRSENDKYFVNTLCTCITDTRKFDLIVRRIESIVKVMNALKWPLLLISFYAIFISLLVLFFFFSYFESFLLVSICFSTK